MKTQTKKLGTRGSPLALWQAERVKHLLTRQCPDVNIELVIIETKGDKILDKPFIQVGGKGIFTKEIENALLDKSIDFAVHSFKDLPTAQPDGLSIVSIPERSAPFDCLIARQGDSLAALPENPVIATGSLRRRSQVLIARPDAKVVDIRGNVNTRLRKFEESDWDALIMAQAGLLRMGWKEKCAGILAVEEMLPAPAQGALAIEARAEDEETRAILQTIHDETIALGVQAERGFLATMEGGCQVPMGAYAEVNEGKLKLHGFVSNLDGSDYFKDTIETGADSPFQTGLALAQKILEMGGQDIVNELKSDTQIR